MPVWLPSMEMPFGFDKMAYNLYPENMESLNSFSRRLSNGQAVNGKPLVSIPPSVVQRPGSSCSISSTSSESTVVPPIHNKNYQESRYKTELCRHWEDSHTCPHGMQCLFAHGLSELRPFRGRHRKFKTQLCKAFHSEGFCSFGPRCSYIHTGADVIPALVQHSKEQTLSPSLDRSLLLRSPVMESPTKLSARLQTLALTSPQKMRLSVFAKICNN